MSQPQCWNWKRCLWFSFLYLALVPAATFSQTTNSNLPEPGPENRGMRLRFSVETTRSGTNDTHRVRIDLINVTDKPISLVGDWPGDQSGTYEEYLEADTSVHTDPPFMPFMGQVGVARRTKPQPYFILWPRKTLTVEWTRTGRGLKNKSIHPFQTHDPTLSMDGLYSVHASLLLRLAENEAALKAKTDSMLSRTTTNGGARPIDDESWRHFQQATADSSPHGTVLLRSNDQLVSVGGSRAAPKHTLAKLSSVDTNHSAASIDLGSAHKIEMGDQFQILTRYIGSLWRLEITNVSVNWSSGLLTPVSRGARVSPDPKVLVPGTHAELIPPNDSRYRSLNLTN